MTGRSTTGTVTTAGGTTSADAGAGRRLTGGRAPARVAGAGLAAALLAITATACGAFHKDKSDSPLNVSIARGGESSLTFTSAGGEVLLNLKAASPEANWGTKGSESAVVSLSVDGTYTTDLVIPASFPIARSVDLGDLDEGKHTLKVTFDENSPAGTKSANLTDLSFQTLSVTDDGYVASQFSPIIYGRAGSGATPDVSGPFQNAVTDTPMVAFHTEIPSATAGNTIFRYSVAFSNEDGAQSVPEMLAEWGRSAQIAWVYQVEVDASGQAVPGTGAVQGQDGSTVRFTGSYEGTHPVIQTCKLTNNVCGKSDGQMRFRLPAVASIDPASEAPEKVMEDNPWTYWMMSQELLREGKTAEDPLDDPSLSPTEVAGDPRSYLYLVLRKTTTGPTPNSDSAWVGVTVGIKLAGNPTIYRSDLKVQEWSVRRDQPASVAIALPPGSVADDIEQIVVMRVVGQAPDTRATVQIQSIEKAFFLDANYLPENSFLFSPAQGTLTAARPQAVLLDRNNGPIIVATETPSATDSPQATPSATESSDTGGVLPSFSIQFPGSTANASTTPSAAPTTPEITISPSA